ncbi:MAG: glycosyltransferase family 4 protein [Clostridium lundense]|nr:glycosyltransferase family 4 protein [Clostridium lundense]MBE6515637.1 glycosyltransferase family 4 protein [Methanocorpusculum parvum]
MNINDKKILHIGLASHYTEDMTYQDQELVIQNRIDGYEVIYVSNCNVYINGRLEATKPEIKKMECGATLIRPKCMYTGTTSQIKNYFYQYLRTIWIYQTIRKIINRYSPQIIFSHDPSIPELLYYASLKKKNKDIRIYYDYHVDALNSGRVNIDALSSGIIVKQLLRILYSLKEEIYREALKLSLQHVDKIYYIWGGVREYLTKWYKIPENMLEFYPLGGKIPDEATYIYTRKRIRDSLNLQSDDILYIHTGKLSPEKRTDEIITAFKAIPNEKFKLIILGSIPDNQKELLPPLINSDSRIKYLGWKTGSELQDYLCASDVYIQLGSASTTMQNALCCGCPVLLNSCNGYYEEFMRGNGMFVNDVDELVNSLNIISTNPDVLEKMKDATWKIALELLDYRKLAARIYE